MRVIGIYLFAWLLPMFAFADVAADVTLRVAEGNYRPGDIVTLEIEMRRAEYAEFELHVPTHPQLHFVAYSREPVRYVEGEYVQRAVLLLQPMYAGDIKLDTITATVTTGELSSEVLLQPPVLITVDSYETEDASTALMVLGETVEETVSPKKNRRLKLLVVILLWVAWRFFRKTKPTPPKLVENDVSLSDLIVALESNAQSPRVIAEHILARTDLEMSPKLRRCMEAVVYSTGTDSATLLRYLKEEVQG